MPPFVHLRTHSQMSFSDGLLLPAKDKSRPHVYSVAKLAAKHGQEAVALTDLHGMFGSVSFYNDARAQGVKPIIGVDAWVDPDVTQPMDSNDKAAVEPSPVRVNLICENYTGYRRLMELLSRSHTENHRADRPRLKQSWFKEGTEGLIALSGDGVHGELVGLFDAGVSDVSRAEADKVVAFYKEAFPGRYFLEVQRFAQPNESTQVAETVALSRRSGVPLVATHPVLFEKRENYYAHEVRTCIATTKIVDDPVRETEFTREQYFKSSEEMAELFADLPEALENSARIAVRCSSDIPLGVPKLPRFATPDGSDESEYFMRLAREGLEKRLESDFPDAAERARVRPEYAARLEHEINVINKMGFPGYFLIVADFIGWSKDNGIPIGPGRGSGAGSLVAYSLRITNINPLPNGLLFERFLNPDRVSMPDFDIDMDIFRRGEIIDYVRQKYGEEAVAQISTTGTSAAKASVRNVARSMGLPYKVGDVIAKLIPPTVGITIDQAMEEEPRLKERYDSEPLIRKVVNVARMLEGTAANVGKHAAGVLIAPGKITDFTPLHLGKEGVVSQYDKDDVETAGLVKFDFLGLATLSIIREATDFINARPEFKEKPFDIEQISLTDPRIFQLFNNGDTVGVFQFESSGMQGTLRKAQPERFEDLVALNALYRPGPMDLIPLYCDRKHGRVPVEYPDPLTEGVLKETYGIMVYQEQVMQVVQLLGGYSLGEADILRRIMGKKKPELMPPERKKFSAGAAKQNISEEKANEIFDLIETFAGYGFNKSHAAAYSLIAYQTAFLKACFPAEFYSASMNVAARQSKQAEIEKLMGDARAHGLKILPPDINEGGPLFEPIKGAAIRYGLSGLKSVSEGPIDEIVRARKEQGKFTSLFDFFSKVSRGSTGKTMAESLIRAGAFDSLHSNRASLIASVPDGIKYASKLAKQEADKGNVLPDDLFGQAPKPKKKKVTEVVEPMLTEATPWSPREQLDNEKKAVGFYFSAHPFDLYAKQLQGVSGSVTLSRVDEIDPAFGKTYLVAGIISEVKKITTGTGRQMARVKISDGLSDRDLTVFPVAFEAHADRLVPGAFLATEVKVEYDRRDQTLPKGMLLEDAWTFEEFEAYQVRSLHIALKKSDLPRLQEIADKHASSPGPNELRTVVYIPENDTHYYRAELHDLKLTSSPAVLADLKDTFGYDKVKMTFDKEIRFRERAPRYGNKRRGGP